MNLASLTTELRDLVLYVRGRRRGKQGKAHEAARLLVRVSDDGSLRDISLAAAAYHLLRCGQVSDARLLTNMLKCKSGKVPHWSAYCDHLEAVMSLDVCAFQEATQRFLACEKDTFTQQNILLFSLREDHSSDRREV